MAARVGDADITVREVRAFSPLASRRASARRVATKTLIALEWVRQDTARLGLAVPISDIKANMDPAAAQTRDVVARLQATALSLRLLQRAVGPPPTDAEVSRYYHTHLREHRSPETRFMKLVATDTRRQAAAAKRALEQGQSWNAVISRYSTREHVVPPSGAFGSSRREAPPNLANALFAARKGTLRGPVRTEDAWYVFEFMAIRRLPRQSLSKVRDNVISSLERRRNAQASKKLRVRLLATYRPRTLCNDSLPLPECRNDQPPRPDHLSIFGE